MPLRAGSVRPQTPGSVDRRVQAGRPPADRSTAGTPLRPTARVAVLTASTPYAHPGDGRRVRPGSVRPPSRFPPRHPGTRQPRLPWQRRARASEVARSDDSANGRRRPRYRSCNDVAGLSLPGRRSRAVFPGNEPDPIPSRAFGTEWPVPFGRRPSLTGGEKPITRGNQWIQKLVRSSRSSPRFITG